MDPVAADEGPSGSSAADPARQAVPPAGADGRTPLGPVPADRATVEGAPPPTVKAAPREASMPSGPESEPEKDPSGPSENAPAPPKKPVAATSVSPPAGKVQTATGEWVDPALTERRARVETGGFIDRQADQSETLLLLNRQLEIAKAINDLIDAAGPDAVVEVAPGEFRSFSDRPAAIRLKRSLEQEKRNAEIARTKSEQEIEKLLNPPPKPEDEPKARNANDSTNVDVQAPRLRNDGTLASQPSAELDALRAELAALRTQMETKQKDAGANPQPLSQQMSLREVYGLLGSYIAVIEYNGERVRVRTGDTLPGEVRVKAVGADSVTVEEAGNTRVLSLRS
ncbi:type IV pilus biogenesis protein PilP [Amorphus sp. 3PC139-8]|uniref:type IV pilus biogenesis protein PilP n=1 Tax=Amorphus sp. 3PC139-8 TaxID=2735676 RepID=UPI00345CCBF4